MKQSELINDLATALSNAQAEFKPVPRNGKGHHGNNFAMFDDIITMVRPILHKYGLSFTQLPFDEEASVGVYTKLMHSSGQWIESKFGITPNTQGAHQYGSCLTYCRRYSIGSVLGIPTDKDVDADDDMGLIPGEKKDKPKHPHHPAKSVEEFF
tara:strand:+ start:1432 stop:1893 length:462 start_codon:yes stop_codon:yes gene_type:complete